MINMDKHVADLVQERPSRARVFEALGINYCCGGAVPFREAVSARGYDPEAIAQTMSASEGTEGDHSQESISGMSTADLLDHISKNHHEPLRQELPRLREMVTKVADGHGDEDPRLIALRDAYYAFEEEILAHLQAEEGKLFPLLRSDAQADPESVRALINELEDDHERSAKALAVMRNVTDGFTVYEGACNTTRATLHAFSELEGEMARHIHTENRVLFPRFQPATA